MWSKGAVVIVKRGDEEIADVIEDGVMSNYINKKEVEPIKRDSDYYKMIKNDQILTAIEDAEYEYGKNYVPPKWLAFIIGWYAFFMYHVVRFVDRFLRL